MSAGEASPQTEASLSPALSSPVFAGLPGQLGRPEESVGSPVWKGNVQGGVHGFSL